jgi:hypothetical protein
MLAVDEGGVYGYGRKPEYFVNSSVLEYHLFCAEREVQETAVREVRGANARINARSRERNANSSDWKLRQAFPPKDLTAVRYRWQLNQPAMQVRAMVATAEALFVAGHPDFVDERRALRLPDDPEVRQALERQAQAIEGLHGGLLWRVSKKDGQLATRYRLASPPVFDGLVAAGGRLYVSTLEGTVECLSGDGAAELQKAAPDSPAQVVSDEPEDPGYLKPLEIDKSDDFQRVAGGRVLQGELGYRLRPAAANRPCLVLQRPEAALTGAFELSARMRVPGVSGHLVNGFVVFGGGPTDRDLVKCGVRFRSKKALIVTGPLKGDSASKGVDVTAAVGETVDLRVRVDLRASKVTLTTCGTSVESALPPALKEVTHVGYATDNAVADFTPLKVQR